MTFSSADAAQEKMPVGPMTAKNKTAVKETPKAADSTLLLQLAPGISAADVKKLLQDHSLKVKKVFANLSKERERTYLSVEPLKKGTVLATEAIQALTATPEIESAGLNYEIHLVEQNPYTNSITGGNLNQNAAAVKPPAVAQPTPARLPDDPRYPELWGLQNMDMETAWNIETGNKQTVVFVIDTGISTTHPELVSNLWSNPGEIPNNGIDDDGNGYIDDVHGIDVVNGDANPEDDHGHGTHVSGTIGAQANNAAGVAGINWETNIGACKFLNAGGSGSLEGAVQCFDYVLGLKNAGVNVVATNNSWGGGGFNQVLHDAIEANIAAGILPVIAAGNSASNNDSYPAYPCAYAFTGVQGDSICVAAIDSSNNLAGFSNYGPVSVDVAAPGVNILSSVPEFVDASGYASWSGTSMATPHVTGLAALLAANKPGSSLNEIREAIFCGATPTDSLTGKVVTGGRANAYNSLQWTCSFPTVTITAPQNLSSVSGIVSISAEASSSSGIAQVDFFVDGTPVGSDTVPPYSAIWDASGLPFGTHLIKAVATATRGGSTAAQVKVYVVNSCSSKRALILDLASDNNSGTTIAAALMQNHIKPEFGSSITALDPAVYPLTFLCLGYYSGQHVITAEESAALSAYLDNGGKLYMEGGDTWAYDADMPIHNYFGINGIADGGFDLATLSGISGSLADGLSFTASGTNAWVDHLEAVNGGVAIWQNSNPVYITGVSNQTAVYRTIGSSFEFGNIPDEATQTQVMAAYLSFFDYVSEGSACPDVSVINFEEAVTSTDGKISDGYKGLNWDENCYALDTVNYGGGILNPSGYVNGITSGKYVAFGAYANPCTITSPAPVVFSGGYFTGAWNNGLTVTAQGYRGNVATGTVIATVNYNGPAWVDFTPLGTIDRLVLSSTGGTDANSGDQGSGSHFALDDLKIQTGAVAHTVTPSAGAGGSINPDSPQSVNHGSTTSFTVTPNTGYSIEKVEGCGGTLSGNVYTTAPVTADCAVTANFKINTYTVTPSAGTDGSISPNSPQSVNHGSSTSFTVTPNTGYSIEKVEGCGGTLNGNIYTTAPVTADCTVTAEFISNTIYIVTPKAGVHGSIAPSVPQQVHKGRKASFTVTPDTGYAISSVTGCGGTLNGNIYTTAPATANCTVKASFKISTYTVTPSAGAGGSINPSAPQTVNYGRTARFTVSPNTGYSINKVEGCGGTLSGSVYTTAQVMADCTVTASFKIKTYTVTPSAGAGGSISPSTPQSVNHGSAASFTVTPTTGYRINKVTGCGGLLNGSIYTTGPISSSCIVNASFRRN
jgi:subtilisin family serine protease